MLTPHAGELARLLETDSEAIGARRLDSARRAAREAQAIVVLKGDDTLVAAPDGRVGVSRGGAAGARDRRHRRRALGRDRRVPGQAHGPVPRRVRRRARARPRRAAGGAGDRARGRDRQRRDRGAARARWRRERPDRWRCARWPASTSRRSSATSRGSASGLAGGAGAVRGRQGQRLRPRRACRRRGRRSPAGRGSLAVATAGEAAELRAGGIDAPVLVMGAVSDEELPVALARAGPSVVAWSEPFVGAHARGALRRCRARRRCACTSSSTPAWAGSGRAILTRRCASPRASPRRRRRSSSPAR